MDYPQHVTITEVGMRDGLQNEPIFVATKTKVALIDLLSSSGLQNIEVTSFVSEKLIPQFVDNYLVFTQIKKSANIHFSVLVPNEQGMLKAIAAGAKKIAIFTAASESFNQRNIHCSIEDSIDRFKSVMLLSKKHHIFVRAYISCAFGCPYEGKISVRKLVGIVDKLQILGVNEICLGDTIGVSTPKQTETVIKELLLSLPANKLAMHFHDTYGQAIANIYACLEHNVCNFDSSLAGLGGCPYALGASGNVATEDLLYLMQGLGIKTGVDLFKVVECGAMLCKILGKSNQSKAATALGG